MTLVIQKPTGGKLVCAKIPQPLDADAQAYVNLVERADGQRIEDPVRFAINNFVIGCKADGIWTAIKASCILAGARTLAGALVPLVGTAPTNFNFVAGDYNRKTGLIGGGPGSIKYLNTNQNNNVDPQNNKHISVFVTERGPTSTSYLLDSGETNPGVSQILSSGSLKYSGNINQSVRVGPGSITGSAFTFVGLSRASSSAVSLRFGSTTETFSSNSTTPLNATFFLHTGTINRNFSSDSRLAFYSIGESLDLALLDARVTTLINALGAAIP